MRGGAVTSARGSAESAGHVASHSPVQERWRAWAPLCSASHGHRRGSSQPTPREPWVQAAAPGMVFQAALPTPFAGLCRNHQPGGEPAGPSRVLDTGGKWKGRGRGLSPRGGVRRWPHTGRTPLRAAEGTDASLGFRLPHPEIRPPRLLVTAAHGSWLHDHLSWLGWAGQGRAGRVQWLGYVIGHRPAWVAPSPHCHTAGGWGPSWAVSGAWALTAWQLSSKSKFSERQGVRAAGRSSAHDWRGDPPSTLPSSKRCHRPARPQARRQEETDKGGGHGTFRWEARPSSSLKNVPRHPLGSQLLTGK